MNLPWHTLLRGSTKLPCQTREKNQNEHVTRRWETRGTVGKHPLLPGVPLPKATKPVALEASRQHGETPGYSRTRPRLPPVTLEGIPCGCWPRAGARYPQRGPTVWFNVPLMRFLTAMGCPRLPARCPVPSRRGGGPTRSGAVLGWSDGADVEGIGMRTGMEGEPGRGAESMAQVFHIGLRQCGKT